MERKLKNTLAASLLVVLIINSIGIIALHLPASSGGDGVDLLIVTNPACEECFDASQYQPELEAIGVVFEEVSLVDQDSREGKRAIRRHGLTKLPALIFSEELGEYETITASWDRVGTRGKGGSYLLQGANPPFYDLEAEEVRGLVTVTYLDMAACAECYDPQLHQQVLERYGMVFAEEREVDVSSPEGEALVTQYGITKVPTVLLQGDASLYPGFDSVWQSVGSRFEDGTYIFTNLDSIQQPYYDLEADESVTPE